LQDFGPQLTPVDRSWSWVVDIGPGSS
jgi:hypothetical protein